MQKLPIYSLAVSACALASCASEPVEEPLAGDWTLNAEESRISFVSVKAGVIAEPHYFPGISGNVTAGGDAMLEIDLASVQTQLEIRDERMRDFLFDVADFPTASVSTQIDPAELAGLTSGDRIVLPSTVTLDMRGVAIDLDAELAVTRTAADKVKVETTSPVIVDASRIDLADGLEELRSLANLPSITGQVPVTVSLTFEQAE